MYVEVVRFPYEVRPSSFCFAPWYPLRQAVLPSCWPRSKYPFALPPPRQIALLSRWLSSQYPVCFAASLSIVLLSRPVSKSPVCFVLLCRLSVVEFSYPVRQALSICFSVSHKFCQQWKFESLRNETCDLGYGSWLPICLT